MGAGVLQIAERVNGQNTSLTMPGIPLNDTSVWYSLRTVGRLVHYGLYRQAGASAATLGLKRDHLSTYPAKQHACRFRPAVRNVEFDDIQVCTVVPHTQETPWP